MKADDIIGTVVTANGVLNITFASVVGAALRHQCVAMLKAVSPSDYTTYKSLRFPSGGPKTVASRRASAEFALAKAAEIALTHYWKAE
jgi:hypothetical protein